MRRGNPVRALFFLFCFGAAALTLCGPAAGAGDAPAQAKLTKAPYIQNLTPTSVVIKWETAAPRNSEVLYRKPGEKRWQAARGNGQAVLHETLLPGLKPGTRYEYCVPDGAMKPGEGGGPVVRFRTPLKNPRRVRFVVYGDTRTLPDRHRAVINAILKRGGEELDFVVHTGDLIADGRRRERWGPEFFEPAAPLMNHVPFYPVLGNHERNTKLYFDLFALPGNERYYSLRRGPAHVIFLDSNWPMEPGSEQYKWLVADLEQAKAPWRFVVCHHPPYTSGPHGRLDKTGRPAEKPIRDLRRHLEPLFERYGVAAVFAGHDHIYERSVKNGVQYVVTGGGGAPLYDAPPDKTRNPFSKVLKTHVNHFCVLDVTADRMKMSVYGTDGALVDGVDLNRDGKPGRKAAVDAD